MKLILDESKADELKLIDFAGDELASRFLKIRSRLKSPENDLYYWIKNKTVDELEATVAKIENTKTRSQVEKEDSHGAKLVGENEYWKVYHITTFEAAKKYGKDTKWCITGINNYGNKYWNEYTEKGIQFYFYITKGQYDPRGKNSKIALAFYDLNKYEIYDQQDVKIDIIENAPKIAGLPYWESLDEYLYTGEDIPINILIKKIIIADSVTSIKDRAFYNCKNIVSVVIPDSVTSIGNYAFYDCSRLTSVTIGNSVTSIGSYAFKSCRNLKNVTIPNSVTSIGKDAFSVCSSLTSITIPDSVTSVGENGFKSCSNLTSVTIGNSVTAIENRAFSGCDNLKSVTIGNSVTSIGVAAFLYCDSLTSITIPDSVISIGRSAFNGCTGLTSVVIGDSVTSIGYEAFYNCTKLKSVTIPSSVASIDEYAFRGCNNLTIYCEAENQPTGWNTDWNTSWNNFKYPVVWGYKKTSSKKQLTERYLSGRYVWCNYKDIQGMSINQLCNYVEELYKNKFRREVKVSDVIDQSYDYHNKELPFIVEADLGDEESVKGCDGFWFIVNCTEEEAKKLQGADLNESASDLKTKKTVLNQLLDDLRLLLTCETLVDVEKLNDKFNVFDALNTVKNNIENGMSEEDSVIDAQSYLMQRTATLQREVTSAKNASIKPVNESVEGESKYVYFFPYVGARQLPKAQALKMARDKLKLMEEGSGAGEVGQGFAIYCVESNDGEESWTARNSTKEFLKTLEGMTESLQEGKMKELAIEIQNEGGKDKWLSAMSKRIAEMREMLSYLKNEAPREVNRGGNFDSYEELAEAVADIEKELDELLVKVQAVA